MTLYLGNSNKQKVILDGIVYRFNLGISDIITPPSPPSPPSLPESSAEIANIVFGENCTIASPSANLFAYGTDNTNEKWTTYSVMRNYETYVIPVEKLGLSPTDTVYIRNNNDDGFIFTLMHLTSSFGDVTGGSIATVGGETKTLTLRYDDAYLYFQVLKQSNPNDTNTREFFEKTDIPLEDLKIYKNSVSEETELDYISVWRNMINYDYTYRDTTSMKFLFHNADADQGVDIYTDTEGFTAFDVDLRRTQDGYWINAHDPTISGLTISNTTLAELQSANDYVENFDNIVKYAKDNNICLFLCDNTVRDDSVTMSINARYSQANIDEIFAIVDKYDMRDNVILTAAYLENYEQINTNNIHVEIWSETTGTHSQNLSRYQELANRSRSLTIVSKPENRQTLAQLQELVALNIKLIMRITPTVKDCVNLFETYVSIIDDVIVWTGFEIPHSIPIFIAGTRYAKGF